ncbi:hypothetical protein OH786_36120 (plasmid) [Streptomyces atratus]|uniref:Uncharacterized protein n=1 Tax=Streptomyces atratus TaxID=1893 RepID=A0A1K1ZZV1_STRAR|nr:hypothetical protein [Streptomyces atratus]SFX79140.1 hypothetical protein SAMN02787144_1006170 [Streptomyces atratus]
MVRLTRERAATAEHSGTAESHTTSAVPQPPTPSAGSIADALGAFARTWLERMPLADGTPSFGRVHLRSPAGVLDDEPIRDAFGQVTHLEALLLALALESHAPADAPSVRQVRRAQLVLRLLGARVPRRIRRSASVTPSTSFRPARIWAGSPSPTPGTLGAAP